MGYSMEQRNSEFRIKNENIGLAHDALKMLDDVVWAEVKDIRKSRTLFEAFDEMRWALDVNSDGDVDGIQFEGEKAGGDELHYFGLIAPYVEKGSFIEMMGEDGSRWRWVFDGETCEEISPKVEW